MHIGLFFSLSIQYFKLISCRYTAAPTVPVLVGSDNKVFRVPVGLLRLHSEYICSLTDDTEFYNEFDIITRPGCEEVVFAYYVEWLYAGAVISRPINFENKYLHKDKPVEEDETNNLIDFRVVKPLPAITWMPNFLKWYALAIKLQSDSFKAHLREEFADIESRIDPTLFKLEDVQFAYNALRKKTR